MTSLVARSTLAKPTRRVRVASNSRPVVVAGSLLLAVVFIFWMLHLGLLRDYYDDNTSIWLSENANLLLLLLLRHDNNNNNNNNKNGTLTAQDLADNAQFARRVADGTLPRCAVLLYGLPRAFAALVLPSLSRHVIRPNARYGCDYYVHAYNVTRESYARSGRGGIVDPTQVGLLLPDAVRAVHRQHHQQQQQQQQEQQQQEQQPTTTNARLPTVQIRVDGDEAFWQRHGKLVAQIMTTKDDANDGRPLYLPWKEKSYTERTVYNILKSWHSIQSAWELMTSHSARHNVSYERVAVLRADVVYVTPLDVWQRGGMPVVVAAAAAGAAAGAGAAAAGKPENNHARSRPKAEPVYDARNVHVRLPGFARHPVSDRAIVGPAAAVQVWATARADFLVQEHAPWCARHWPGRALHSETLVYRLLLAGGGAAPLRRACPDCVVEEDPALCFWRARADKSVWFQDCDRLTDGGDVDEANGHGKTSEEKRDDDDDSLAATADDDDDAVAVATTVVETPMVASSYIQLPPLIQDRRALLESIVGHSCHGRIYRIVPGSGKRGARAMPCPMPTITQSSNDQKNVTIGSPKI